MNKRRALCAVAMERARGRCDFCVDREPEWGRYLTHLHSIGMGGRKSADEDPFNWGWGCYRCARFTDGEHAAGEFDEYARWNEIVLGRPWQEVNGPGLAYRRAEALAKLLKERYGWMMEVEA